MIYKEYLLDGMDEYVWTNKFVLHYSTDGMDEYIWMNISTGKSSADNPFIN